MSTNGWHRKNPVSPAALARRSQYRSREHKALRAHLQPTVAAGLATCCRCGRPIAPNAPWHLDHNDSRTGYLGPAHALCNLKAAGSKGARVVNAKRQRKVTALPM